MLFDNLKILYAEDEELLRETMRSIIAKEVKAFYVARDGEEAYKLYKELKPD